MSSVNKAFIVGNLGGDPEAKSTDSGANLCTFSVATSHRYKRNDGENVEETEWHRIVVWGKQADACVQYLAKGAKVCVEGRIKTRRYEDADGIERYSTEIVAQHVTFLGSAGGSSEPSSDGNRRGQQQQRRQAQQSKGRSGGSKQRSTYQPEPEGYDDDIPF